MDYALKTMKSKTASWLRLQKPKKSGRRKQNTFTPIRSAAKREFDVRGILRLGFDVSAGLFLLIALVYGMFHAYRFFTTTTQFSISQVTFHGNQVIEGTSLLNVAQPVYGQNIFKVDLADVLSRIEHNPWIQDVSIIRKLPQSLHIHIQERTPYARLELDKVYLMDNYGILIAPAEGRYDNLPLIRGASMETVNPGQTVNVEWIIPGLQAMHSLNQLEPFQDNPLSRFRFTNPDHLVFQTENGALEIRMGAHRLHEGFDNLKIVLEASGSDFQNVSFVDLSFTNQVVVRPVEEGKTGSKLKQT